MMYVILMFPSYCRSKQIYMYGVKFEICNPCVIRVLITYISKCICSLRGKQLKNNQCDKNMLAVFINLGSW